MANIGTLEEVSREGGNELHGHIRTLQMELNVRLVPNRNITGNAPNYLVLAKSSYGEETQIGGAWKKIPKSTGFPGDEFLSITIDDPSFPTPLNVAAFAQGNGTWDITWRRRQAVA